ncbi:unnamed protein product [Microthlaspi erraticum]|uniref:F-box domain-containing protein n=1 Tax=Microthlaspi erraticum TaxID=1685480 RepID=A0A6D2HV59_9BRAS|nr:unnamed protein product [Microthlaspi erraticum]
MLKRPRSSMVLRRHRSRVVELLPHDVVELILERLPVKSLLRFRSVSENWKSTIDSRHFKERQFCHRESRGPDVLCVKLTDYGDESDDGPDTDAPSVELGSSIVSTVRFPTTASNYCHGSCDGLVCLYSLYEESGNVVSNPATRFHRSFPLSSFQHLLIDKLKKGELGYGIAQLGFVKDKVRGTFKPVWLYNSSPFGLDNATTCEVFDFSTNAWRYVVPASPYRILAHERPVYLDGSLYWFTECEETKLLSFDLHTETFQVVCKAPFAHVRCPYSVTMCILDNRLCVSRKNGLTQVIWSLDSSGGSKTWKKMCSIALTKTFSWFEGDTLLPIAILDKTKLLLHCHGYSQPLVIHDLHVKSYDLLFKPTKLVGPVCYFESLFSVLSN